MENNENFVNETENVEQTTEQIAQQTTPPAVEQPAPKMYTQEEVDAIVGKRIARNTAKIRKDYDRQYGELADVLKAGTGKEDIGEITEGFRQFYASKGTQTPRRTELSAGDIEVLAKAEAADIIGAGYEEVVEEVDRLAKLGAANMTDREKAVFRVLAEHRQNAERSRELAELGVTEDVYNSKEFTDFAAKFTPGTPIRDIYDIFEKTQPKKDIRPMGSMKQVQDIGAKDYYTPEEIERLTEEDLDDPKVWEAVRRSMTGR